ncbi:cytochrome P450 [Poronia punctata]|nr:cytochrome P450 [Poronia punctata]
MLQTTELFDSGGILLRYALYLLIPWALSLLIYQLFLHPLRKYPGPFLAKFTYGYGGFHAIKGRHDVNVFKNFQKYGRVYREAPNRLLFNSLEAIQDIYSNPNITKGPAYRHSTAVTNMFNVRENAEHRRKRKVAGQVVSERALRSFSPVLKKEVDIFLRQVLKADTVNMTLACNRLTVDIMAHLAFGADLKSQTEETNRFMPESLCGGLHMNNLYYTWPAVAKLTPLFRWLNRKKGALFKQKVSSMIVERVALPPDSKQDFYGVVTGKGGLGDGELWGEAFLFVLAGGTTVATAICGSLFHLSCHRDVYTRLATEIRGTFSSSDEIEAGPKLASCTYLRAVTNESLRLSTPAPSPLWRELEVHQGPFVVDGHVIPPGTEVGVHLWAIMHNPEYFEDPFAFVPERWLSVDGKADDAQEKREAQAKMRRAHVAFGLGDRGCAGKNMAYLEMSLVIAKIFWYFDFERASGDAGKLGCGEGGKDPWDAVDQFQVYGVLGADHDGPNLVFKPRGEYWKELVTES